MCALDGVSLNIKQMMDLPGDFNIRWAIIASIAGALQRLQLRKAAFPIAQYMLRQIQFFCQFANCKKCPVSFAHADRLRSEKHTSDIQSLMPISYAVFCWKK